MTRDSFNKFKEQYKEIPMFKELILKAGEIVTARELALQKQVNQLQLQVDQLKSELTK